MKTLAKVCIIAAAACILPAPGTAQTERRNFGSENSRREIIFPQVNGMNVYKTDLHTHTICSDGDITPALRVIEAWRDGLDAIAITDHIEYRRIERDMYRFMQPYIKEEYRGEKFAINTNVMTTPPDERGLLVDFNVSYDWARKKGAELGILVIRGVEITRKHLGDYNALFTKDNNAIFDLDAEKTIRNARAQGAFIIHNHPQFNAKNANKLTDFCTSLYEKGLIDGVEVGNSNCFYRWIIDHTLDNSYTPTSNTDVHGLTDFDYRSDSRDASIRYRNMTLIIAPSCDEESLHEALRAGRTIAYHDNMLIGKEDLLKALFTASVKFDVIGKSGKNKSVRITNNSSMPYTIRTGNNTIRIAPLGATVVKMAGDNGSASVTVENMWCGTERHPQITVELD